VGAAWGAAMNPLLPLGAYAAIRRERGETFSYTGGVAHVMEMVDPRLLGQAFAWAADAAEAANETFNITNGDVYAWPEVWPAMADAFGMLQGLDEPMRLAEYLPAHEAEWDEVVKRYGLRPLKLAAFLCESHHYIDALARPGVEDLARPILVSTIKLRQAGFAPCRDTAAMFADWFARLRALRFLP
jgi:nucleoside-diphosphate-sugar epimerase